MSIEPTATAAMDCAEFERALDAYLDGELDEAERAGASTHLGACARCHAAAVERARVRSAIRRCLRDAMGEAGPQHAPSSLRVRIVEALERERRPRLRSLLSPLPAAALAACIAAVAAFLLVRSDGDRLAEEAVRRHARDLPLEVTTDTAPAASIAAWFDGKLDFNPRPPHFADPHVRLVGARLSHIGDRPAAYIRYEVPRGRVGLFVIEDPERRFGHSGRAVHAGPDVVRLVNAHGYNIAVWRRNAIVYSLVGDLDEEQLATLVRSASAHVPER